MNKALQVVLGILVVGVVASGSFYGGMVYGKSQAQVFPFPAGGRQDILLGGTPGAAQAGQGQQGTFIRRGSGQGGGMVFGEIQEIGEGTLVVADESGKQTRVLVTDTTLIEKNASVALKDLATGEIVIISGSQGSDGSITARSVQVSPAGRFGMGAPGAGNAP